MDIVKLSIEKPVSVSVGVILILLFGIIGLQSMPYQLTPRVTEPEISVQTTWPGATPYEIERDVVDEQEEVLKGLRGLVEMESTSFDGFGEVLLTFQVGTEIDDALLRVSNALNEVEAYPENVDRPVIESSGATESPVVWTMLKPNQGNDRPIRTYLTFFEDEVRQYLERIEGVSGLFVRGGTEREMQVVIDPIRLAAYSLTIEDVIRLLRAENANISAGNLGVSRRDYRIRTVAQFQSPQEIENLIITSTGQRRVRIKDVGHVHDGYEKQTGATLSNGDYGIVIGVRPQPDANILDLTDRVEEVVTELNEGLLADNDVHIEWLNDRRYYILGAIDLVQQNILIGGGLAILVLLVFLRRPSSTLVVATAIPISVVGSFIFMNALGRNLNIVSMAGISFAVGMLVDNAIVVLENIDRHRNMGKSPYDAAAQGAREVWGAVLASTLTTVAVFLPIVFIQEEAGQLFKDIAIAITCAILISLFVSISVIPMLSRKVLRYFGSSRRRLPGSRLIERAGGVLHHGMMATVGLALRNALTRLATIVLLTSLAVGITVAFFPKMEYLPEGNRNLILSILIPPPGLSFEERTEIGWQVWDKMQPYFRKQTGEYPPIELMFYVSSPTFNIFGASSQDYARPAELIPLMNAIMRELPGMYGVSTQASIFQQGIGEGRTIKVDLSGPDIAALTQAAGAMFGMITKAIPEAQIRPLPSLEMSYPEIVVAPDRERVRAAGMTARELGEAIDVLMDGRIIGDYKQEGEKTFDLVLKASEQDIETPEELLPPWWPRPPDGPCPSPPWPDHSGPPA
jgi:HAE1 family hydrophobic/amphiphilic exporter-1